MSREEALSLYWQIRYELLSAKHKEAVDIAFKALEEQLEDKTDDD